MLPNKIFIVEVFFEDIDSSSNVIHSIHYDRNIAQSFADSVNSKFELKKNSLCPLDLKLNESRRPINEYGEVDYNSLDILPEIDSNLYYNWFFEMCEADLFKGAYIREYPIDQILQSC